MVETEFQDRFLKPLGHSSCSTARLMSALQCFGLKRQSKRWMPVRGIVCGQGRRGACNWGLGSYLPDMRAWVSILMVLAWLGYGLMPALAGQTRQVIMLSDTGAQQAMGMAAHETHRAGTARAMPVGGCAHCPGMSHAASCPGCLATLPDMPTSDLTILFRYPAPWRGERLTALAPVPPTPPPRG